MYKIIALISEAGSGKDRILKEVLAAAPDRLNEIISCTTRPMREGEINGINYYFLTKEEFLLKAVRGHMIEKAYFNGWHYGTSYDTLSADKINIGVFNPTGIYSLLKRDDIELWVYKIEVKDKTRLLRQLNREEDPNVNEIIRRYQTDKTDFQNLYFEYNNLPNETIEDLQAAVKEILTQAQAISGEGQN
jgi:guanylate kinase